MLVSPDSADERRCAQDVVRAIKREILGMKTFLVTDVAWDEQPWRLGGVTLRGNCRVEPREAAKVLEAGLKERCAPGWPPSLCVRVRILPSLTFVAQSSRCEKVGAGIATLLCCQEGVLTRCVASLRCFKRGAGVALPACERAQEPRRASHTRGCVVLARHVASEAPRRAAGVTDAPNNACQKQPQRSQRARRAQVRRQVHGLSRVRRA